MQRPPLGALGLCFALLAVGLAAAGVRGAENLPPPAEPVPDTVAITQGPFESTWESLVQYACPAWFRDAKLGIWGILGPQSLPEAGDWYARHMYVEGHAQYTHHVEHYGHPSKHGYKDLARAWKAEKFDPDRLMALYKEAGAKYFVVLANHHDNWDNWDSRYHRWNAVNVGPKQDLVGLWAKAARAHGLRFGVTEHLARSYSWFNTNKGADTKGAFKGVPYDGRDPVYEDLYFPPHDDTRATYPENPPAWWPRNWFWRMRDLIDRYDPDLMYSDGAVPFGEVGRSLLAHFYNANVARRDGRLEAVYCLKDHRPRTDHGDYVPGIGVQDVERGVLDAISPDPWQTDTCIGNWFYRQGMTYKSPAMVIALLADIVSKNGNLLLNVPLKHDGTIDDREEAFLHAFGAWMRVNGEAIYGTRPWKVFGEGRRKGKGGHFNERRYTAMGASDIRFTTRGPVLYAIALGRPEDGRLLVRSLGRLPEGEQGTVTDVRLLGHAGDVAWKQTDEGLAVTLPAEMPCAHAPVLKIAGRGLRPAPWADVIRPAKDGTLVLPARDADIHGRTPRYEVGGGKDNIGYWNDPKDYVSWEVAVEKPGPYAVEVTYSCAAGAGGSRFSVAAGEVSLVAAAAETGSWATFRTDAVGTLALPAAGRCTIAVRPRTLPSWKVIGLKAVTLRPAGAD